ncbi:MAG: hypothetical protein DRP10_02910 [Candidatus Aenigmatarchaeota archaeon]|nr:MAG: hypothetical protein DRP10_02910 [Candidatus Aenigmarchaeota archaeon]
MPNRREHEKISKILLGKTCTKTHQMMDYPAKYLGKKHRKFFHNNPLEAMAIGQIADGDAMCGYLHYKLDTDKEFAKKIKKWIKILRL